MDGLIIKMPWLDRILCGEKDIEVRGSLTSKVGKRIWLLSDGWCLGSATIDYCFQFDAALWKKYRERHCVSFDYQHLLNIYHKPCGWRLTKVKRCKPRRYKHPHGTVIWVKDVEFE